MGCATGMSDAALQYAEANRKRFVAELKEILSIPSISTLPEHRPDMQRAARWLTDRLNDMGIDAETIGEGRPLVYGEWLKAEGAPTILLYGHYDVQPIDPLDEWKTPPFEPDVRDGNIYARGAADDKGQVMTLIDAAESFLRTSGALPVNLRFLIEGEEECGGELVSAYVRDHGDRLRADVAEVADTGLFAPGIPTLETGLRGIAYVEVEARGASHDLHSGLYGGVAPNPFNALAHIISRLKDPNGKITIPGFYDDVHMPPQDVLDSWKQLPFDPNEMLENEIGASELVGEPGFTALEQMWARPTLDVHGIRGGFTGEGAKTVIPATATAKISMRLVPDQKVREVYDRFREYVLSLKQPGIELDVRFLHGDDPVVVPADSRFIEAAETALQETFGRP
ncbi:MAG TPA: M20/M25/M40 family metallo-hydrolase, partial [Chloroflexota bacterium]|nr:M20/M25/M40 family metallo-hydrolase [Chloroflexota bacterium]